GEDLLQLINQVLDLSKIEAGKQDVSLAPVDLRDVTTALGRIFSPLAGEKGLELVIEHAPDAPSQIHTDRSRVERILTNLLGNSIKFTERGRVTLAVKRPRGAPSGRPGLTADSSVAFSVTDTGIGIPDSERDRVFVPFEQLEATSSRRYQGTGLGLSIARESAILLGGELTLESKVGQGSTFTLILPESRAQTEPPVASQVQTTDDRENLEAAEAHILLIEDDAILAEQLVDIIHGRGLKALVARSGEEGLESARKRRPHG